MAAATALVLTGCQAERPASDAGERSHARTATSKPVQPGERALTAATFGAALAKAQARAGSVRTSGKIALQGGQRLKWTADVSVGRSSDDLRMVVLDNYAGQSINETRVVGTDVYAASYAYGATPGDSLHAQPWTQTSLTDRDDLNVRNVAGLIRLTDPSTVRAFYADAKDVQDLGQEQVDGVRARHFRVTVPRRALYDGIDLAALDDATADEVRAEIDDARGERIDADVWLDRDGLPVRAEVDGLAVDFSDWGQPVVVKAPQTSDVTIADVAVD